MDKIFKNKSNIDWSFQIKVKGRKETVKHNATAKQFTRQLQNRTGENIKCLYNIDTHGDISDSDKIACHAVPGATLNYLVDKKRKKEEVDLELLSPSKSHSTSVQIVDTENERVGRRDSIHHTAQELVSSSPTRRDSRNNVFIKQEP
jgi:hypothetical protein